MINRLKLFFFLQRNLGSNFERAQSSEHYFTSTGVKRPHRLQLLPQLSPLPGQRPKVKEIFLYQPSITNFLLSCQIPKLRDIIFLIVVSKNTTQASSDTWVVKPKGRTVSQIL
jgi:hypothetical protein